MITTIKLQESRKAQILARLPGHCQATIEDRFSRTRPECVNCRRQVLNYANHQGDQSENPEVAAERLRHLMSHLDCPGGNVLRRQQLREDGRQARS